MEVRNTGEHGLRALAERALLKGLTIEQARYAPPIGPLSRASIQQGILGGGMNAMPIAAWIGVAVFVVSVLNLAWILSKEYRTRRNLRTMICIEIEDNLARLKQFWSSAESASTFSRSPLSTLQKNDAFRFNPLPILGHRIWESLTASIPVALGADKIRKVHYFHAELDEISKLKEGDDTPSKHAAHLREAIERVIQNGNPLER